MSIAKKLNHGYAFSIDLSAAEPVKLEDLMDDVPDDLPDDGQNEHKVIALGIKRGGTYGDSAWAVVVLLSGVLGFVWLPAHKVNDVREILSTPEFVQEIKDGKTGITVRRATSEKYKRKFLTIDWTEIEPAE